MTLLEAIPSETFREGSIPVLETERLVLRAPRLEDAKTVALARQRPPHRREHGAHSASLRLADAEHFIAAPTRRDGEATFLITLRDGDRDRRLRHRATRGASAGARLLARRALLGQGLRHRGAARGDRLRLRRSRPSRRCRPAPASPIRPRAGCWRSAASSGPASGSTASARSTPRRRSTASASTAACGPRSRAGDA